MKKFFNDNAKTIALLALAGCVAMGIVLYNKNRKQKPCAPAPELPADGKVKVEETTEPAGN